MGVVARRAATAARGGMEARLVALVAREASGVRQVAQVAAMAATAVRMAVRRTVQMVVLAPPSIYGGG